MNERFFHILYFTFFLLIILLVGQPAIGQAGTAPSIAARLGNYLDKAVEEKIYLHTDKEYYVAGEILWFKTYYVDGSLRDSIHLSKIAYIDVLNKEGKAVLQAKVSLNPGQGKGSFYLPLTLPTGRYTIRAYTNWMKNFEAGYFFRKSLIIVNTMKAQLRSPTRDTVAYSIDVFPEGGNLVSGLTAKIGFKATDNTGKGVDFTGFLVDEAGDTLIRLRPLNFGMGNFVFTPQRNHQYKVIAAFPNGKGMVRNLPAAYPSGFVMSLGDEDRTDLRIVVYKKDDDGSPPPEWVTLTAHARQKLQVVEEKIIVNNDSVVFLIDKGKLERGVTHFTIFNGKGQPVCERLFFQKPEKQIIVNASAEKASYGTRHEVSMTLGAHFSKEVHSPLHLSASVVNIDGLQQEAQATIVSYMSLASDLTGDVESPDYYLTDDPMASKAADNLMLTQGWRRFRWENVLNEAGDFIKFLPEYNGHFVMGKIVNNRNGNAIADRYAYLAIPGRPFGFYVSKSDKSGQLEFEVRDYYGRGEIIARADDQMDSSSRVEIQSPFVEGNIGDSAAPYQLPEDAEEQLVDRSVGMQVQNVYRVDRQKYFEAPPLKDTLPFYGKPAFTYLLDDYKRFTTMEEVLREYVREIGVRNKDNKLFLRMYNPEWHDFYDGNVLVLLDGVPLLDGNKIFTYDPLKVKALDIVQKRYVLGTAIFNGIASFRTYDGTFNAFSLDPSLVSINYEGLQLSREFYSPAYTNSDQLDSRIPDFRNTLLWVPDLNMDKEGKKEIRFFTSDRRGKFVLVLQGMSEDGEFVSTQTSFEVK